VLEEMEVMEEIEVIDEWKIGGLARRIKNKKC